jgi:5'-methylthioadenosine phosphorylase
MTRVGVIGGTGLYALDGLTDVIEERVDTPWGAPSSPLVRGRLGSREVVFLARHGVGHGLLPSEVPYRANVYALKAAGCSHLVAVSAVGSLREAIAPGHVVLVDQFIDRTRGRPSTYFGNGIVAHVPFGDPTCADLRVVLRSAAQREGITAHDGGTYVTMEGPAFSTRAESRLYRQMGGDVIGMTNGTEARLAREAGLSFATVALATDWDAWRDGHDSVTADEVMGVLRANVKTARALLRAALPQIEGPSRCADVLSTSLVTPLDAVPPASRGWLDVLRGRTG